MRERNAKDFAYAATKIEFTLAREMGGKRINGTFGEDIASATGEMFEVKSYRGNLSGQTIKTTPNEAAAVMRARARKAWVCFVQNRSGKPGDKLWFRSDLAEVSLTSRIRHFLSGDAIQDRISLKWSKEMGMSETPESLR